jgi:hypothetical protein
VSFFNRYRGAGWGSFRDAYLNADPMQQQQGGLGDFDAFSRWEARQCRYDIFWAMWQSNAFRELAHFWAAAFKHQLGLYKHTRNIFNPVHRCVEFHVAHLLGGTLDRAAGDGVRARTAVPIETENERIRPAIAKLWRDGKFAAAKSVWTRYGACMGDAPLIVDDDPERQRVTLRVIHPGHLKWVDWDSAGNVRSYIIERWRYDPQAPPVKDLNPTVDPRGTKTMVKYNEEAFVDKGQVTYRTWKNGALYNWRGFTADGAELPAEWTVPYDFIPLVLAQHQDIGLPWGVAEPHAMLSKSVEADDQASGLGDQIRKRIRAPKLLSGMRAPTGPPFDTRENCKPTWSETDRQETPFLYGPEGTQVHDLTNDLDVPGVSSHIKSIVEELERDYPELQMDIWATGDPSGRALRVARQRTEHKIQERRVGYDSGLVQAQKYALAIGSLRGYPGYEGFTGDPREDGDLDHDIAHRPVFAPDPLDDTEEASAFWLMVGNAVKAGMPLEIVLEREGWDMEDIQKVVQVKEAKAAKATATQRTNTTTAEMPASPGDQAANTNKVPDTGDMRVK